MVWTRVMEGDEFIKSWKNDHGKWPWQWPIKAMALARAMARARALARARTMARAGVRPVGSRRAVGGRSAGGRRTVGGRSADGRRTVGHGRLQPLKISQVGRRSAAAQPGNRFVSFVRARGDCQVEMSLKRDPATFPLSLFGREAFPFPLGSSPSSKAPIQL